MTETVADETGTARVAAALAATLGPGEVVHLVGDLGAGKTTFVRHAAKALGVAEPVTSPTFAVAHRYRGRDGLPVAHLDLYRSRFQPSEKLERPYTMLGVNVFAAESESEARRLFTSLQQAFINLRRGRPGPLKPPAEGFDGSLAPFERAMLADMLSFSVVGTREQVRAGLAGIVARTGADELMVATQIYDHSTRLESYTLAAEAAEIPAGIAAMATPR